MSWSCNGVEREFPHVSNVVAREGLHPAFMEAVLLDACHSVWIFDMDRMRYCRISQGPREAHPDRLRANGARTRTSRSMRRTPGSPCSLGRIGAGSSDRGYTVTSAASAPYAELPTSGSRIFARQFPLPTTLNDSHHRFFILQQDLRVPPHTRRVGDAVQCRTAAEITIPICQTRTDGVSTRCSAMNQTCIS